MKYFVATGPRGLPQGACTSPGLSNQVARRLDRRPGGIAGKLERCLHEVRRRLDVFRRRALEGRIGYLMARVAAHRRGAEGFAVNEGKSRVLAAKVLRRS